ncbi:MAG: undecaprenyl-diphosphate phosphatase [Cyclobacteriaceae bacterium]
MTVFEAILLGIIQGLTEFLPISSSGHIELTRGILQTEFSDNLLFSIVVHGATALSTVVVFRKDIIEIIREIFKFQWNEHTRFAAQIVISIIPVAIIGLLFEDQVEAVFTGRIGFVGLMLLITGLLLSFTSFKKSMDQEITFKKALIIGIAQSIAIMPGISRSGATIATALLLGVRKEDATRFSFLMVLVPILGATFLKVLDFVENPAIAASTSAITLITGFVVAFLVGLAACTWMIKIVKRGKLIYFAIYCFIAGTIAIIYAAL